MTFTPQSNQNNERIEAKNAGLYAVPSAVFELAESLRILDLSGNPSLSSLPEAMGSLTQLRVAFFSDCGFRVFPAQLSLCQNLQMAAFRNNQMHSVPEQALPTHIRWLILTNNLIESLPHSIGECTNLEKLMLAGNKLSDLPDEMRRCTQLALLRISANRFKQLPDWLFEMPRLAFLAFAGNPTATHDKIPAKRIQQVDWKNLEILNELGTGASGVVSEAIWKESSSNSATRVAVKVFKANLTSDGLPQDEIAASLRAGGSHPNLLTAIAVVTNHPENAQALILPLLPKDRFKILGGTPSFDSCTRDVYPDNSTVRLSVRQMVKILGSVADATAHLHDCGISHGDLYAHNILVDAEGTAVFGDFGAATLYEKENRKEAEAWEKLEVLAFAHLIEDLLGLVRRGEDIPENDKSKLTILEEIHRKCSVLVVNDRPVFAQIASTLKDL